MKTNKTLLLLGTMLRSTSGINVLKYSSDKKKKGKIIGNYFGLLLIFLMIIGFSVLSAVGYGIMGLTDAIPASCAISISALSFVFILLKSNGYLFGFKEYDMLMAMPFETRTLVACKFLYMYIKNLSWYMSISIAMLIGYGIFAKPAFYIYILWILVSFIIPVIPSVAASAIGALIVRVGIKFKHKKLVQTILTFIFIGFCFSLRFIISAMFKNNQTEVVMENMSAIVDNIGKYYIPARWFGDIILHGSLISLLLYVLISIILFSLFFRAVSISYLKMNSRMSAGVAKKDFVMSAQKKRSIVKSVAFKEYKRLTASTLYLTNAGFGELAALIIGIVALFIDGNKILSVVLEGAPVTTDMILPAVPLVVYFLIGMVPTTCCSPSLEGKNYWIVQSLPISRLDLFKGKMLFNICLTVPFALVSTLCLGFSFGADLVYMILFAIQAVVSCLFSTCFGMITGVRFMKLDWENEVEAIKQGTAVVAYLFPNMILTMLLCVLAVAGGIFFNGKIVVLMITIFQFVLTLIFYQIIKRMAKAH